MEPAERVAHAVVKLVFVVFALIVSLVFDEFGHGALGLVIFIIGAAFGVLAITVWKTI
jgi:lipopolysaccharide export LptBFGC system permease protein LptF